MDWIPTAILMGIACTIGFLLGVCVAAEWLNRPIGRVLYAEHDEDPTDEAGEVRAEECCRMAEDLSRATSERANNRK
jgi:hypothetical protein